MTNVQHKLIQDVKEQKEVTSLQHTKIKQLEGIINHIVLNVTDNNERLDDLKLDVDINNSRCLSLKNDVSLATKLLLATATLTIINFIMLVVTVINL